MKLTHINIPTYQAKKKSSTVAACLSVCMSITVFSFSFHHAWPKYHPFYCASLPGYKKLHETQCYFGYLYLFDSLTSFKAKELIFLYFARACMADLFQFFCSCTSLCQTLLMSLPRWWQAVWRWLRHGPGISQNVTGLTKDATPPSHDIFCFVEMKWQVKEMDAFKMNFVQCPFFDVI